MAFPNDGTASCLEHSSFSSGMRMSDPDWGMPETSLSFRPPYRYHYKTADPMGFV